MTWRPIETAPKNRDFAMRMRNEKTGAIGVRVNMVRSSDPKLVIQGPGADYVVEWAEVGTPLNTP